MTRMSRRALIGLLLALAVAGLSCRQERRRSDSSTAGRELVGGTRLLYQLDEAQAGQAERVIQVLRQRADSCGVAGPIWRAVGPDGLEVIIPPTSQPDVENVKRMVDRPFGPAFRIAVLAHELSADQRESLLAGLQAGTLDAEPGRLRWVEAADAESAERNRALTGLCQGKTYVLLFSTPDKCMAWSPGAAWRVKRAYVDRDEWGGPSVGFALDEAGAEQFRRLTGGNLGKPLALVLDDRVVSLATIQSMIGSAGRITGRFTREQAAELAERLGQAGLAGTLRLVSESRVE